MKQLEQPDQALSEKQAEAEQPEQPPEKTNKSGRLFASFLFLLLAALMAAGAFYGWEYFKQYREQLESQISELQSLLQQRPTRTQIETTIQPLQRSVGQTDGRLGSLEQQQQDLLDATQKLYELYGRDENGWKLAEVEYLMSIAQHKLVLENDFEGAAKTLLAASDMIAELADPGLLPVRVQINEEVAQLKTRVRPDLVGMTLLVARLGRQISSLKPGYQSRVTSDSMPANGQQAPADPDLPLAQRLEDFFQSLVTIKTTQPRIEQIEQTLVMDVSEKLEDNLKLTRWALLERDAVQYQRLMDENVSLFKEYYDLQDAANADFYESLLKLKQSPIKPMLPDISGSLRMLKELQQKRETAPEQMAEPVPAPQQESQPPQQQQEADNG